MCRIWRRSRSWRTTSKSKTCVDFSRTKFANIGPIRLQKERHALNALLKQPPIPPLTPAATDSPKSSKRYPKNTTHEHLNTSLLDPSQQAILASLRPPASDAAQSEPQDDSTPLPQTRPPISPSTVSARLSDITTSLAPVLDSFSLGVHDIELYRSSADAVSSQILRVCAERLEERDALNTRQRLAIEGEEGGQSGRKLAAERSREDIGIILGALSRVERR